MAKKESERKDGIEAIGIMTPAGNHYSIAKAFIKNNVHVICDKPLTATIKDAEKFECFNEEYMENKRVELIEFLERSIEIKIMIECHL